MRGALGKTALYGLAIGLQRGLPLLCLFPATALMGIEGYALYAIAQTLILLAAGPVGLNGAAAVMREGVEDDAHGVALLWRFTGITAVVTALAALGAGVLGQPAWISLSILIAGFEAVHLSLFALMRARERADLYAGLAAFRTAGVLLVLSACFLLPEPSLEMVLALQLVVYALAAGAGGAMLRLPPGGVRLSLRGVPWPVLAYTAPLILHMSGLWVLSSANRLILLEHHGKTVSGAYSALFAMATPLILIVAVLGVVVPASQLKAFEAWRSGRPSLKVIGLSATATLIMLAVVQVAAVLSVRFGFLPSAGMEDASLILTLIGVGFFIMGGYTIYGNYFLYFRKSLVFSAITLGAATLHISFAWFAIDLYAGVGAAAASCLSYTLYLMAIVVALRWYDRELYQTGIRDIGLIAALACAIGSASAAMGAAMSG